MLVTSKDEITTIYFSNYDNDHNPLEIITVLVAGGLDCV